MDQGTAELLHAVITAIFIGTWIVLAIVGGLVSRRMDAAAKRRWMPRWVILVGILFAIFATTLTILESRSLASAGILIVIVPAVALTSYLSTKFTKFCDNCGATLYNHNWFTPMRFCSKCGAKLVDGKPSKVDGLLE